jgi:excisionase family DNA binding protein
MAMQMKENDSLVLTPMETAKLLRVGRSMVYEQIRLGVIPSVRLGRKILVPRFALLKMLEESNKTFAKPIETFFELSKGSTPQMTGKQKHEPR